MSEANTQNSSIQAQPNASRANTTGTLSNKGIQNQSVGNSSKGTVGNSTAAAKPEEVPGSGKNMRNRMFLLRKNKREADAAAMLTNKNKFHGHQAAIDEIDANEPFDGVDFWAKNTPSEFEKYYNVETNADYLALREKILKRFPYSNFKPSKDVPMYLIIRRIDRVYAGASPSLRAKALIKNMFSCLRKHHRMSQMRLDQARGGEYRREIDENLKEVSKSMVPGQAALYEIAKLVSQKSMDANTLRSHFESLYFAPKNITMKAMNAVIVSEIDFIAAASGSKKSKRYNLPPRKIVDELALKLGFADIEEMQEQIGRSSLLSTIRAFRDPHQSEDAASSIHDFDEYMRRTQNPKARDFVSKLKKKTKSKENLTDFNDKDDIVYENEFVERQMQFETDELRDVLNADPTKVKVTPFAYGAEFAYKMLYYYYLNEYSYILPFGQTIPDLPWLLTFSYITDSTNTLGLRLDYDRYLLKVGGVPLVEKSAVYTEDVDARLKKMFRSSLSNSPGSSGSMKQLVTASIVSAVKISNLKYVQSNSVDQIGRLKADVSTQLRSLEYTLKNSELTEDPCYQDRLSALRLLKIDAFAGDLKGIHKFTKNVIRDLGGEYEDPGNKAAELRAMFSERMYAAAEMMAGYASSWDAGDSSKTWFVRSIQSMSASGSDFGMIYNMFKKDSYARTLQVLFRTKEKYASTEKCLQLATKFLTDPNDPTYARLVASAFFDNPEAADEYVVSTAESIIREDPEIAALVLESMKRKEKASTHRKKFPTGRKNTTGRNHANSSFNAAQPAS
jgi:hypothetical protein